MAIKGLSHFETERFSSTLDDAPDDLSKTWFIIGPLDVNCRAFIGDYQSLIVADPVGGNAVLTRAATRNLDAVRFGLRGVENFKDEAGSDIPMTFVDRVVGGRVYKIVDDKFLSQMPPMLIAELGEKIMGLNTLTEDMRKKFETQ